MEGVDPRFRQMGKGAKQRRRRRYALRTGVAVAVLMLAGAGGYLLRCDGPQPLAPGKDAQVQALVQVGPEFDIAPVVRADTFTDLPGDPLIIPGAEIAAQTGQIRLAAPPALTASQRVRNPQGQVVLASVDLVPRDQRLVATLPSSREEFALFQAERSNAALPDASASQAQTLAGAAPLSETLFLRPAQTRPGLWQDLILETRRDSDIAQLLTQNGFPLPQAKALEARITAQLGLKDAVPSGSVLALRHRLRGDEDQVLQLSLYQPEGYVGSLAMSGSGQLQAGADPWAGQPILSDLMARNGAAGAAVQQRLLDVIYSAALRQGIPTEVIGRALALMSRVYDLDGFADEDDRLTLIFDSMDQDTPREILFIGVSGPSGDKPCYIVAEAPGQPADCIVPGKGAPAPALASVDGLHAPVSGVLSQRFVPPGQRQEAASLRGHVLWSAPQGARVQAVAAGVVTALIKDGPLGAMIELTHKGGLQSRYLGLGGIASGVTQGAELADGAALGVVGQPKGQDRPGLVFQLLENGVPVDPLTRFGAVTEVAGSGVIEALINRIIHVESAGNSTARNPLSTATGLGQFIESTWLRMVGSYRPDLIASLSRKEVLDLRLDPDMSRQMVRHLAQENEAYLRGRGHQISAGRLYLAHFLGPKGADMILAAAPSASVGQVMGQNVVAANPFLSGFSAADLQNWADRKMTGTSSIAAPVVRQISAVTQQFIAAIDSLRQGAGGVSPR